MSTASYSRRSCGLSADQVVCRSEYHQGAQLVLVRAREAGRPEVRSTALMNGSDQSLLRRFRPLRNRPTVFWCHVPGSWRRDGENGKRTEKKARRVAEEQPSKPRAGCPCVLAQQVRHDDRLEQDRMSGPREWVHWRQNQSAFMFRSPSLNGHRRQPASCPRRSAAPSPPDAPRRRAAGSAAHRRPRSGAAAAPPRGEKSRW